MYEKLKSLLGRIMPHRLMVRNEELFRHIYYMFYRGNNYQCPICERKLRKFIGLNTNETICPACGSLARNRRLWSILDTEFLHEGIRILDFSPSRSLYRKLKNHRGIDYVSSDFAGEFMADRQYDIAKIPEHDESFDLIICYHILEHIGDDEKAMQELFRVLKKGGHCIFQTPFKEGETFENPSITSPEERLNHFGQADHVRIYSVEGLCERLAKNGFIAKIRKFQETPGNRNGFQQTEFIILAKK